MFLLFLALVCHWALQSSDIASGLLPWQHNFLALFVYASTMIGLFIIVIKPQLTYSESNQKKFGKEVPKMYNDVHSYFKLMKANYKEHFSTNSNDVQEPRVLVYGIGTSISASFLAIFQYLAFFSMLLLGDGLSPSVALIGIIMPLYLYLTSYQRLSKASSLQELMHVPWTCVIGKYFLLWYRYP